MLYREAGQFKSSYAADQAVFPLVQDRIGIGEKIGEFYWGPHCWLRMMPFDRGATMPADWG